MPDPDSGAGRAPMGAANVSDSPPEASDDAHGIRYSPLVAVRHEPPNPELPMPSLDTMIPRFQAADRNTRLETLMDYARKLPPLPERYEAEKALGHALVPECQTPVFLWVEQSDGRVHLHADVPRESPTVRGFVSLLVRTLDGVTPAEVARIPNDLLDQLRLTETLGMMRTQGLSAILMRVKRAVAG